MEWLWFIVGGMFGCAAGVFLVALFSVNKRRR